MILESAIQALQQRRLLSDGQVRAKALTGGVSSEILLLEDGAHQLVLKRSLPKLKVRDDWWADTSRNQVEQQFIRYFGHHLPKSILPVIMADPKAGWFVMEYLGEGVVTWKEQLMAGRFNHRIARAAAELLGMIHRLSWNDPTARQQFRTGENFYALRAHPYLITTGQRHAPLRDLFESEARRLLETHLALVHGDFSPKNIMLLDDRLVLLDHEVAWFGDPAFDVAFLLTHLFLKSLLFPKCREACLELVRTTWLQYFQTLGIDRQAALEPRAVRLLLMLMLARIDGKSPVEYLVGKEPEQQFVRSFVSELLLKGTGDFDSLHTGWSANFKAQ